MNSAQYHGQQPKLGSYERSCVAMLTNTVSAGGGESHQSCTVVRSASLTAQVLELAAARTRLPKSRMADYKATWVTSSR
jgi:hypothetical protein